jgi:WS/DGAT/MGAT family acyltransferase
VRSTPAFLHFEKPHSPLSIGCVAVLEGPVSREELLHHLDTHLAGIQRFSERATPAPFSLAHPAWRPDRGFDLRNHVHRLGVPRPGGEPELCEAIGELMGWPLDRSRPLWEAHLLDGLADERTAVLHRVHHCMLDGVAGAGVLDALLDTGAVARGARPAASGDGSAAHRERRLEPLGTALSDSFGAAWRQTRHALDLVQHPGHLKRGLDPAREISRWALRRVLDAPSPLPWNRSIGPRRRVVFTRFPLAQARAIRAARGCTVNDVVLCVLAGGLRRYLESLGIDPERQPLVAAVPVSVRTPMQRAALGNRLGVLFVPLALGPGEEADRLDRTAALTRRLKEGQGHDALAALLGAADLLPPALVAWIGRRARIPSLAGVIATNVRGPESPRYLAGRRVEALYPIVPVADGLGLGLAVLSYAGVIHVGLNADADRVPDLEKLRAGIEEAAARLFSAL